MPWKYKNSFRTDKWAPSWFSESGFSELFGIGAPLLPEFDLQEHPEGTERLQGHNPGEEVNKEGGEG